MVYVGLPLSHERDCISPISWRTLNLDIRARRWEETTILIDAYYKSMKAIENHQRRTFQSVAAGLPELLAQKGKKGSKEGHVAL